MVIERPQPDQRTAYIEASGGTVSNVDWQLCSDSTGSICDDVHATHTVSETFGGLFLTGVVSATINYVDGVSNPPQQLQGILPQSAMSASFSHNPVNASEDFTALLNGASGNGLLQGTTWKFGATQAQNFAPPAGVEELFDTSNLIGMGTLPVTVTQQWLDSGGSGIVSNYRVRSSLTIRPMPQGTFDCGVGSTVSFVCNATRPAGLPANPDESYSWDGGGLVATSSNHTLNSLWKYQPGTYSMSVVATTQDETSDGYREWDARGTQKLLPQGSFNCLTGTFNYSCTAMAPAGVNGTSTIDWRWVLTSRLGAPTLTNLPAGLPLSLPRDCNMNGGLVWIVGKDAVGNNIWVVFGTPFIDSKFPVLQCEHLPLIQR